VAASWSQSETTSPGEVGGRPAAHKSQRAEAAPSGACPDSVRAVTGQRVRQHVIISGYVQGVWFRETMRRTAERRGIAGWVRNTHRGTVEAVFEGPADAVDRMVEWCRLGPPDARVADVAARSEPPEGLASFVIRSQI
jgi:acylphosphatase